MTLLISKVNQLGDNVVFLPVVQQLRIFMPDLRIVVATSPVAALLFEKCVDDVEVLAIPTREFNAAWKHPTRMLGLANAWRSIRPEVVMIGNDQGNVAALLSWISGAVVRVGPASPKLHATKFINHLVSYDLERHVVLQNWDIARETAVALGSSLSGLPPAPDLSGMASVECEAHDVIIHPGASRDYKRWPLDDFAALANALSNRYKVAWIYDGRSVPLSQTVSVIQPASLSHFVSLMSKAGMFIGNNSGPMNIASALGVGGIIFNGPSTANWDPFWNREKFVILRDHQLNCQPCDRVDRPVDKCRNFANPMACMKRWGVAQVLSIAERHLESKSLI